LEHGSVPHYNSVIPKERDKWKAHLAQRFGKPKEEIGMSDWKRANSWKEPSIIWTAMDAGLRPIEVGRARVSWIDLENSLLRIPREDSSKNTENWTVSLLERTTNILKKWIEERKQYPKRTQTKSGSHATTTPTAPNHSTTSSKESAKPPTSLNKTETSPGTQYVTQ
jgi:integrase